MKYKIDVPEDYSKNILIPISDLVDEILELYDLLNEADFNKLLNLPHSEEELNKLEEEYFEQSKIYSKLRQEYGQLNYQANELFTRNTITGLKLGLLRSKLFQAKKKWEGNIALDFDAALRLIDHFAEVYLLKRELEQETSETEK
ncbi:MAG: hypothetical protein ACTSYD_04285 [Candidatus Heimdallarchaeaceae archaeon]